MKSIVSFLGYTWGAIAAAVCLFVAVALAVFIGGVFAFIIGVWLIIHKRSFDSCVDIFVSSCGRRPSNDFDSIYS